MISDEELARLLGAAAEASPFAEADTGDLSGRLAERLREALGPSLRVVLQFDTGKADFGRFMEILRREWGADVDEEVVLRALREAAERT